MSPALAEHEERLLDEHEHHPGAYEDETRWDGFKRLANLTWTLAITDSKLQRTLTRAFQRAKAGRAG